MKISTFFTALIMVAALFLSNEATAQSSSDRADEVTQELVQNYSLSTNVAQEVKEYNRLIAERLEGINKATVGAIDARTRKFEDYENRYLARMKKLLGKAAYTRAQADLKASFKELQK